MECIPTQQRCIELLEEYNCSDDIIQHCLAVRDIAIRIAQHAHADMKLVEAGALLHDIGRSKANGITHAVEGVRIARQCGLPLDILYIIERHIGAGIPKEEALQLGLPEKDYIPETLEEKIVAHADNLIDHVSRHKIIHEINQAKQKGLLSYAQRLQKLHDELSHICGMDVDDI
ncbi:MAG: HDIG domain-containing protein [Thermoplasmatota archaeon]